MFRPLARSVTLIATLLAAGAAHAVTFDFSGKTVSSRAAHTESVGGLSLSIYGRRCAGSDCSGGSASNVQRWRNGIGLQAFSGEDHEFDGWGPNEMAVLSFNTSVDLQGLDFHYIDESWDDFALWRKDQGIWTQVLGAQSILDTDGTAGRRGGYLFDKPIRGQTFGVATTDWDDGWKLRGVTADFPSGDTNVPEVPLPAGMLLLVGALGTFAALRRKA